MIMEGVGRGLVVAVGQYSQWGLLKLALDNPKKDKKAGKDNGHKAEKEEKESGEESDDDEEKGKDKNKKEKDKEQKKKEKKEKEDEEKVLSVFLLSYF